MKGKLDERGQLWLVRAGKMKLQYCSRSENGTCGDHCPLMREPHPVKVLSASIDLVDLDICEEVTLSFGVDEFTDERQ